MELYTVYTKGEIVCLFICAGTLVDDKYKTQRVDAFVCGMYTKTLAK